MSTFDPTDIDFAVCDEQTRAGNGSWTVPTRDLYGTSDAANTAGAADWSALE